MLMAEGLNWSQASSRTHESLPGTMRCEAAVPIAIEVKLNSSHCGFSQLILHSSLNQAWKLDSHWETINDKTKMESVWEKRKRDFCYAVWAKWFLEIPTEFQGVSVTDFKHTFNTCQCAERVCYFLLNI